MAKVKSMRSESGTYIAVVLPIVSTFTSSLYSFLQSLTIDSLNRFLGYVGLQPAKKQRMKTVIARPPHAAEAIPFRLLRSLRSLTMTFINSSGLQIHLGMLAVFFEYLLYLVVIELVLVQKLFREPIEDRKST